MSSYSLKVRKESNFRLPSTTLAEALSLSYLILRDLVYGISFTYCVIWWGQRRGTLGSIFLSFPFMCCSYCSHFYDAGRPMRRMAKLEHSRTCPQHLFKPRASIAQSSSSSRTSLQPNKRTRQSLKTISMSLLFDHEQQHTQKKKKKTILLSEHHRRASSSRLFGRANEICQRLRPRQRVLDPLASLD